MSETALQFKGNDLRVEPVNVSLAEIANTLNHGQPAVAILEPGDATRYRLLLVAAWALYVGESLGDIGIPAQESRNYLFVIRYDGHKADGWFANAHSGQWDVHSAIKNEWSRELLAWWVKQLWEEINRQRINE